MEARHYSIFRTTPHSDESRLWAESESRTLFSDLTVKRKEKLARGRSREECERHLKDIYTFIFESKEVQAIRYRGTPGWTGNEANAFLTKPYCESLVQDSNARITHYYNLMYKALEIYCGSVEKGITQAVEGYNTGKDLPENKIKQQRKYQMQFTLSATRPWKLRRRGAKSHHRCMSRICASKIIKHAADYY